jgi:hypothetical protein
LKKTGVILLLYFMKSLKLLVNILKLTFFLLIVSNLKSEEMIFDFLFTHIAETTTVPLLIERETRMEVTFDTEKMEGELKYYSPFSDSFEVSDVKVKVVTKGLHFISENKNGMECLSFGLFDGLASYSSSSVMGGVNCSYLLFGKGRILEKR